MGKDVGVAINTGVQVRFPAFFLTVGCMVVAYILMAYAVMACIVMTYVVTAYIGMAYIGIGYIAMAYNCDVFGHCLCRHGMAKTIPQLALDREVSELWPI